MGRVTTTTNWREVDIVPKARIWQIKEMRDMRCTGQEQEEELNATMATEHKKTTEHDWSRERIRRRLSSRT